MVKRVEIAILKEERQALDAEAVRWAKKEKHTLAPRNGYIKSQVITFLDGVDEDKSPQVLAHDNALISKEVEEWERCRAAGLPVPKLEHYGVIKRAPSLGDNYERVEFRLSVADYIRLRNYAAGQGVTVSAMTRIILGLLDEEELAG